MKWRHIAEHSQFIISCDKPLFVKDFWCSGLVKVGAVAMPVTGRGGPLLAWALAYIKPSMGLPSVEITPAWMVINLFVVCTVGEGTFFRGVVQRSLGRVMPPALDSGAATALSRKA